MINYQEIIKELRDEDVEQLLYTLGAEEVIRKDNCFITNTICHNEEGGSLKLYYYFDTHLFYCFSEDGAMTIFKFLETYYINRGYDYDWYKDIYKVILNCSNYRKNFETIERYKPVRDLYTTREVLELPEYRKGVLDIFTKTYPVEWLEDNITKEAMDKFNISYSISQNKIIIPHYDVNGRLVGIRGRALDSWEVENIGKYLPVKIEDTLYNHKLSMNLYGIYENKENIKRCGVAFIAEGEKSCLQAESFPIPNCVVAACGSNFNIYQLKLLMKECAPREIVICFDQEETKHSDVYFNKLYNMCIKYKHYTNISFLYDREGLLRLKESPFDEGYEVFQQLLSKRVEVK